MKTENKKRTNKQNDNYIWLIIKVLHVLYLCQFKAIGVHETSVIEGISFIENISDESLFVKHLQTSAHLNFQHKSW